MPREGTPLVPDPRRRTRSRAIPILVVLGVLSVTLICVVSPLRYFYSVPPPPRRSDTTLSRSYSSDLGDELRYARGGGGGLFKSGDSEAVNLNPTTTRFERFVGTTVDTLGDLVLALFGFDEQDWFDFTEDGLTPSEEQEWSQLGIHGIGIGPGGARVRTGSPGIGGDNGGTGTGLSSWSESSLYVERTQSLHPSRPSAFGPHLLEKPLRGDLYPISIDTSSPYGCSLPSSLTTTKVGGRQDWIALVQRGECPFSNKVRIAQELGAKAVVFGDEAEEHGGIKGGKGLLTPWSPDDTKDIKIPSIFVSRASYLSLIKTWQDEQRIVLGGGEGGSSTSEGTQTDLLLKSDYVGLEVVLSKDEIFAWPLLDLLFLLLFLPSLLTLLTVFTQRVRMARAQKAERAPKSAVAKLVVFRWGEPTPEKPATTTTMATATASLNGTVRIGDEEREIGLRPLDDAEEEAAEQLEATESTSLLRSNPTATSPTSTAPTTSASPSLLNRLRHLLPRRLSLRRRSSSVSPSSVPNSSSSSSSSSSSLPLRGPNPRYPSLTDCSICLEAFVVNESIVIELPCSHIYHRDCAMSWLLTRKGVCPICRKSVMEDDVDSGGPAGVQD